MILPLSSFKSIKTFEDVRFSIRFYNDYLLFSSPTDVIVVLVPRESEFKRSFSYVEYSVRYDLHLRNNLLKSPFLKKVCRHLSLNYSHGTSSIYADTVVFEESVPWRPVWRTTLQIRTSVVFSCKGITLVLTKGELLKKVVEDGYNIKRTEEFTYQLYTVPICRIWLRESRIEIMNIFLVRVVF